jgi:hypothetical protein
MTEWNGKWLSSVGQMCMGRSEACQLWALIVGQLMQARTGSVPRGVLSEAQLTGWLVRVMDQWPITLGDK